MVPAWPVSGSSFAGGTLRRRGVGVQRAVTFLAGGRACLVLTGSPRPGALAQGSRKHTLLDDGLPGDVRDGEHGVEYVAAREHARHVGAAAARGTDPTPHLTQSNQLRSPGETEKSAFGGNHDPSWPCRPGNSSQPPDCVCARTHEVLGLGLHRNGITPHALRQTQKQADGRPWLFLASGNVSLPGHVLWACFLHTSLEGRPEITEAGTRASTRPGRPPEPDPWAVPKGGLAVKFPKCGCRMDRTGRTQAGGEVERGTLISTGLHPECTVRGQPRSPNAMAPPRRLHPPTHPPTGSRRRIGQLGPLCGQGTRQGSGGPASSPPAEWETFARLVRSSEPQRNSWELDTTPQGPARNQRSQQPCALLSLGSRKR